MKAILSLLAVGGMFLGGGLGFWYWQEHSHRDATFRTAMLEYGSVWATISATGTVMAEEQIDVGAQVAGQIKYFGADPQNPSRTIDFNSVVDKGTVLAQLDDTVYKSRVAQARANFHRAEAQARLARARLLQAEREWERVQRLGPQRVISGVDYDLAKANYEAARGTLEDSAAAVDQAKAALQEAEENLGFTTIRSPVKGVIIHRKVNVGQTVVASLSAPSMFIISPDLTRMQVWAAVNEADVGNVHAGQGVRFTVDAYPNREFTGEVFQTRLNATMTQNVVIYTVVVNTNNSDQKLLPNMTANLRFDVDRRTGVLVAPNSALRWKPQLQLVAPDIREEYARSLGRKAAVIMGTTGEQGTRTGAGQLWVQDGGFVRPVKVRTGITDGTVTEIVEGDVDEGTEVVLGEASANGTEQKVNPFTPQFNRRPQQQ